MSQIKYTENNQVSNEEELKQLRGKKEVLRWFKCEQRGQIPSARDSHSAVVVNN